MNRQLMSMSNQVNTNNSQSKVLQAIQLW